MIYVAVSIYDMILELGRVTVRKLVSVEYIFCRVLLGISIRYPIGYLFCRIL